ncbi:MAG: protein O-mannosyl-transferase family [Phycisphaerae bacterium]
MSDPVATSSPQGSTWKGWRLFLVSFLVSAVIYGLTTQRGPAWQDSGVFQWRIHDFDLTGRMGLALAHPLLIVIGKAFSWFPWGPIAWRMNMVSAVFAALAAASVALLVRRLAPRPAAAAWIAGGFYALAHTVWWLATIVESQAVHVALFTACLHALVSLVRRPQRLMAFLLGLLAGLALMAHNLALLALPAYGLTVIYLCAKRRLGWSAVGLLIVGWLIGAGGFLAMVVQKAGEVGVTASVNSALFGDSWRSDVLGGSGRAVVMGCGYIIYNLPNLALPLMLIGLWSMRRMAGGPLAWALGYLVLVYFVFAVRYTVQDQFMFFLPFYALAAVIAGIGLGRLCQAGMRRWLLWLAAAGVLLTPVIYKAAPHVWQDLRLPLPGREDLPYRSAARYWLVPWKETEDSAGQFARAAMKSVPPGSIIIADGTAYYPLEWVQRVERARSDAVILLDDEATRQKVPEGTPNVFTVSNQPGYVPGWLECAAEFKPWPDATRPDSRILYEIWWRPSASRP